ncbi:Hpt domain-containing protein [Nocardioides sp.]|uniref:Hpt domain-containing protein n=1 Tax=Nocardioides sp. TaxID=35761 RepID=UPI002B26DC53|nr:Hpt domain-containing protein [Nocardioides sp.]
MTVFDVSALRRLEGDTQSPEFVHSLVGTYRRMLDDRVTRILEALEQADSDRALDAAHSLRVSSIMTGLVEIADVATGVADALRAADLGSARKAGSSLRAAAERAAAALTAYLDEDLHAQESTDSIR